MTACGKTIIVNQLLNNLIPGILLARHAKSTVLFILEFDVADLRYKTIIVINQQNQVHPLKMEPNKKLDKEYIYVFETTKEITVSKFRRKIWQILPSICGKLRLQSKSV